MIGEWYYFFLLSCTEKVNCNRGQKSKKNKNIFIYFAQFK